MNNGIIEYMNTRINTGIIEYMNAKIKYRNYELGEKKNP
jgi:hypothetical protein